tara:strand:+ start:125 stop:331 length:207 start_codon:yes stop_codon:yes gene_type:complete
MNNLKLLNKKYLSIILSFLIFGFNAQSLEPVDIWNVEGDTIKDAPILESSKKKSIPQNTIYEMQSKKN